MYILGINAYHPDSAACLIKDGKLVAALEEERIRRIKHWAGLPTEAIKFCLNFAGINLEQVDYIAVSRNPKAHFLKKVFFALQNRLGFNLISSRLANLKKIGCISALLAKEFNLKQSQLKPKIFNIEHHRAHLASAFFVSPFDKAAVLSIDGMGDFASAMWGVGEGSKIKIIDYVGYPHSLGFLYTAFTQYLGFLKHGDEYKVMGLSAFGRPVYLEKIRDLVRLGKNGSFKLNLDYFIHHKDGTDMTWAGGEPVIWKIYSEKLIQLLGPARNPSEAIEKRHEDIAASAQALYEEIFFKILKNLYNQTQSESLCFAGGTAQNSLANGKILKNSSFKKIYIPPAGHDAGTAIGAAYYLYNQLLDKPRGFVMDSAFWGPEYDNKIIREILEKNALKYQYLDNEDLVKKTAGFLADGKIVGWFQGRTEWGPRALGSRSILANPCLPNMKDILNLKIKKREPFRPFAPSIIEEAVGDYFEDNHPVPFMEKVYVIKPEKRKLIPAVAHVDGTGRLQTVSKKTSPLYWSLINEFGEITGVPIVLNTSFNENEPIVNRPEEAIDCFSRTKMDVLVLGNYLIQR